MPKPAAHARGPENGDAEKTKHEMLSDGSPKKKASDDRSFATFADYLIGRSLVGPWRLQDLVPVCPG
jgi:hypothetical protein